MILNEIEHNVELHTYRDSNCVDPCFFELIDMVLGEPSIPVLRECLINSVGIRFGECTKWYA